MISEELNEKGMLRPIENEMYTCTSLLKKKSVKFTENTSVITTNHCRRFSEIFLCRNIRRKNDMI